MQESPSPPKHILIVGGGSAGWMTASVFAQSFGQAGSRITVIESPNIPTIGVGEGTTPLFRRFLRYLQVPEEQFLAACKATFKLGINFPGWTNSAEFATYFHPFASSAYNELEPQFFANCDARRRGMPAQTSPSDFFFTAAMAKQGKAPVGPPPYKAAGVDYGYHFDTAFLADFLKKRCIERGVQHVIDDVSDVVQTASGDISHVVTANSGELRADLFVDCTGFRRLLLGKLLDAAPISFEPRLFNNSAVVIRTRVPEFGNLPPYTEATALNCGWAWRIPLMNKISWGYVYSNNYTSRDAAEAELRAHIGDDATGIEPLYIRLHTGRVTEHWKRNCLAVGLSQGFIEPLEATALGLTQFTINRFATHFARGQFEPTYRDHFNAIVNEAFDATINYIQMHYKLSSRDDTQYWRDCANNENISDAMRELIAGWESPHTDFKLVLKKEVHRSSYAPYSWYCILSGMGRYPKETQGQFLTAMPVPYASDVGHCYNHRRYLESVQQK